MNILIACEESGTVRRAFNVMGHNAKSCDILPSADHSENHIQGDIQDVDLSEFDLMIAHPPCTFMCNSGVSWLHKDPKRWDELRYANEFFNYLWKSEIKHICIENPIPHKYALLPRYDQLIQPWQFGHGETKATCLWLKNLPQLKPTNIVDGREQRLHKLPPSKDRAKIRSRTYQGIAKAMAEQWGDLLVTLGENGN